MIESRVFTTGQVEKVLIHPPLPNLQEKVRQPTVFLPVRLLDPFFLLAAVISRQQQLILPLVPCTA
jgi:hypothetical protein